MEKNIFGKDFDLYDMEVIDKLYNSRLCGIPLSFYLLDNRKTNTYCHRVSDYFAYFIEDAKRVEGQIESIIGKDKSHSWVEKGEYVYDIGDGLKWKKDSFYSYFSPKDIKVYTRDEIFNEISEYLEYTDNMPEMYVALINDIRDNIDKCLYGKILEMHIKKFIEEKHLDKLEINTELLDKYMNGLKEIYEHIDSFIEEAKSESKK